IDPAAVPPDPPPGPPAPMKQNSYCTEVGVLPGSDFRLQPKYMDMLNLQEAWQFGRGAGIKVAVIATGVTPHPRFPHLIPGGDYVMGGDGLSDCDAHGTLVASMIGAAPSSTDAFSGVAPDVDLITIPQTSQEFTFRGPYAGSEDPQTVRRLDAIQTLARAIVHAAN